MLPQHLEIITTPSSDWLFDKASQCATRMLVASPYVSPLLQDLSSRVVKAATRVLVTRTDVRDFALGASDIRTLRVLSEKGVSVMTLHGLHAKVYVFDSAYALVTSANATHSGLKKNFECGIAVRDVTAVESLAAAVLTGFGAKSPPEPLSTDDLASIEKLLPTIKVSVRPSTTPREAYDVGPSEETKIEVLNEGNLLASLSGWQRLTLEGVLESGTAEFRLEDIYRSCLPKAADRYPDNLHPKDKLRQQLQQLRSLGFVEFLEPGRYRRTTT